MAGRFKSEINDADFNRANQRKIEAAVDAVDRDYQNLIASQNLDPMGEMFAVVKDIKTLLDAWKWLHAGYHHFQKYHAADSDAWDHGEHYLGTECVNCEYSRSQYRAIVEHLRRSG
jgi:hypothetical protein